MEDRATAAWTDFRIRFVLTSAVLVAAGVLVGIEDGAPRVALLALVVGVIMAALHLDAFIGIVVGLAAAAAMVLVKQLAGSWGAQELFVVAAEVTTLVELAWIVGLLGNHLREVLRRLSRPVPGSLVPAHGSLGLLDLGTATVRLEEELLRCSRTGQPLSLVLVSTELVDAGLDDDAATAARRAVARHVETLSRDIDVPFAVSPSVLGVILPSTDRTEAWSMLGMLLETAGGASFADRTSGLRHHVSDAIEVTACLVSADGDTAGAHELVDAALEELEARSDQRAGA